MTNEIRRLLKKVKEVEQEYGYLCDWVLLMKMEEYTGREFQLVLRPNVVS